MKSEEARTIQATILGFGGEDYIGSTRYQGGGTGILLSGAQGNIASMEASLVETLLGKTNISQFNVKRSTIDDTLAASDDVFDLNEMRASTEKSLQNSNYQDERFGYLDLMNNAHAQAKKLEPPTLSQ